MADIAATSRSDAHSSKGTVLTTGADSGIGLATAIEVARLGYRSTGSVRSDDKAAVLEAEAKATGVAAEPVLLDVTDADRPDAARPSGATRDAQRRPGSHNQCLV